MIATSIGLTIPAVDAEPRFGDSTWVAPGGAVEGDPTEPGPRVARPDHERGWETALRAPFRVAFFPLRLVALGVEYGAELVGTRMVASPNAAKKPGFGFGIGPNLDFGGVNDNGLRAVGIGPAIATHGFPNASSQLNLHGSWSGLDRRRLHLSGMIGDRQPVGLRLDAEYDYKPNRRYFGIGNDSPHSNRSTFLLEEVNTEAALVLGSSGARRVEFLVGSSSMSPRRGYNGKPRLEEVFPIENALLGHDSRVLLYGVKARAASLDDRKHPALGVAGVGEFRHANGVRSGDPDYHQWIVEGRGYVPVFARRRVIALRAVYAGVDPTGGSEMPFYRLAQSEHELRFAGYTSQRFRDRRLAIGRIEYRWLIHRHVSALGLYELGEVAPHTRSFKARDAHASYGAGIRFASSRESAIRIEAARSIEGTHFALYVGNGF